MKIMNFDVVLSLKELVKHFHKGAGISHTIVKQ